MTTVIAQLDGRYLRKHPLKAWRRLVAYTLFEGRPLTTRGRWINPLVFAELALFKRLPQLRRVEKPVFVLSTGRSGTTIFGVVLSTHREVGFLNEPRALWHSVYPLEDVLGNYTRRTASIALSAEVVTEPVRRSAHRLYGAFLGLTGARRVLDKADWVFRVPFLQAIFPDAKFIFLTRNGWDTCSSIAHWSEEKGVRVADETHDWWGADDRKWRLLYDQIISRDERFAGLGDRLRSCERHTDRAVLEWTVTMSRGLELLATMPTSILAVRYEELTERPRDVLSSVEEFCELKPDPRFIRYGVDSLRRTPSRGRFEIDPALRGPFENTLRALGYS